MMPPTSAHRINWAPTSTTPMSISPDAMVLATAVPTSAPTRFMLAASATAWAGDSTLVATTVAIELAVSWNPLMYSNTSATITTVMTRVNIRGASGVLQDDVIRHHTGLAATIDGFFENLEEFLEQEHLQRCQIARVDLPVQLQHQPVGFVLDGTKLVVELLHGLQLDLAQLLDHLHHHPGGLFQHRRARREVDVLQVLQGERVAVGELFHLLVDLVQGRAERLDVLALDR